MFRNQLIFNDNILRPLSLTSGSYESVCGMILTRIYIRRLFLVDPLMGLFLAFDFSHSCESLAEEVEDNTAYDQLHFSLHSSLSHNSTEWDKVASTRPERVQIPHTNHKPCSG